MDNQLLTRFSFLMLGTHQLGLGKGKLQEDGSQDFRCIGIGESSRRLWWGATFSTQGDCLMEFLEPYQLVLGTKGGRQNLALRTAALMELYPDHVFIKDDLTNMFGAACRKEGVTYIFLAPHTSGPRDVPRCGALSLLQKDAALQGGSSRNRCRLNVKLRTSVRGAWWWCVFFYPFSSPNPFRIYLILREQF